MSIENFKNDMIESIEKRTSCGVRLITGASAIKRNGICGECALSMLYHEKIDNSLLTEDKPERIFDIFKHIEKNYSVQITPFIDGFDSRNDSHAECLFKPGSNLYNMFFLGKDIRDRFHPVSYKTF